MDRQFSPSTCSFAPRRRKSQAAPCKNGHIPNGGFVNSGHEVVHLWDLFDLHMTFAAFTSTKSFFPEATARSEKQDLICMRQTTPGYFPMTVISPRGNASVCMNEQCLHFKISCTFYPGCGLAPFIVLLIPMHIKHRKFTRLLYAKGWQMRSKVAQTRQPGSWFSDAHNPCLPCYHFRKVLLQSSLQSQEHAALRPSCVTVRWYFRLPKDSWYDLMLRLPTVRKLTCQGEKGLAFPLTG